MACFTYQAVRQDGETTEGELEVPDAVAVIRQLQGQDLIPLKIRPAGGLSNRLRQSRVCPLAAKEIAVLTRELSTLLESGLTLDRSLQILIDLSPEERIVRVMTTLQGRVSGGSTFAAVLEEQGGQFPRLYVNMVRTGEASGSLEVVLGRLADYLERTNELRETITSALIYPMDPVSDSRPLGDYAAGVRSPPVLGPVRGHGGSPALADPHRHCRRRPVPGLLVGPARSGRGLPWPWNAGSKIRRCGPGSTGGGWLYPCSVT